MEKENIYTIKLDRKIINNIIEAHNFEKIYTEHGGSADHFNVFREVLEKGNSLKMRREIGEKYGMMQKRVSRVFFQGLRLFEHRLLEIFDKPHPIKSYEKNKIELEERIKMLEVKNRILEEKILKINPQIKISDLSEEAKKKIELDKILDTRIRDLDISSRLRNCFDAGDIETLRDVVRLKKDVYLKFRNFGKKRLIELEALVYSKNLTFGMEV